LPLYPRGPRSGPSYSVSVHRHLICPIRPTRQHIATSPQRGLYAMPSLCPERPRRPTSGSGLSLSAPSLHVVLKDPGEPIDCTCPAPSSTASAFTLGGRARRLPTLPSNPFREGRKISGLPVSLSLRPAKLLASLTDPTLTGPTETFTPGLSTGRSPFPPPGITTVVAGRLHRRDLHPLEHQLASLQPPKIPDGEFSSVRFQGRYIRQCLPVDYEVFASHGLQPSFVHLAACSVVPRF
jgi:hypothetical protein